jgi:hypothetical protein
MRFAQLCFWSSNGYFTSDKIFVTGNGRANIGKK